MKKFIAALLSAIFVFSLTSFLLMAEETTVSETTASEETSAACEHTFEFSKIKEVPTHLTEGILIYACTKCRDTEERRLAPIEEHEFGYFTTYSEKEHRRICECGKAEYEPHDFGEWNVEREATAEEAGREKRSCTVCGAVERRDIAKLTPETTTQTTETTTVATEITTAETTAETITEETTLPETNAETTTTAAETTTAETTSYSEPPMDCLDMSWVWIIAAVIVIAVIAAVAIIAIVIVKRKKKK